MYTGVNLVTSASFSYSESWFSTSAAYIGTGATTSGLNGYIYSFTIFNSVFTELDQLLASNPACVYPPVYGECLPLCTDPDKNKDCSPCACASYSCNLESECLVCPSTCPEYCSSSANCLSVADDICNPHPYDSTSKQCIWSCTLHCDICEDFDKCKQCVNQYFLNENGECVETCPSGSYPDAVEMKCIACETKCSSCDSSGCLACADEKAYGPTCDCVAGYFQGETHCERCIVSCATCSSSSSCDMCSDPNAELINGECQCQSGFYETETKTCEECYELCEDCTGPALFDCPSYCTGLGMVKVDNDCVCEFGYYRIDPLECLKCPVGCSTCESQSICTACTTDYTLEQDICKCKEGTYFTENTCKQCHNTCSTCTGPTEFDCLRCADGLSEISDEGCVCVPGSVPSAGNPSVCEQCPLACLECEDVETCLACHDPNAAGPFCECQSGFYAVSETRCNKCAELCKTCNSEACLSCEENADLSGNFCSCIERSVYIGGVCRRLVRVTATIDKSNKITVELGEAIAIDKNSLSITVGDKSIGWSLSSINELKWVITLELTEALVNQQSVVCLKLDEAIGASQTLILETTEFSMELQQKEEGSGLEEDLMEYEEPQAEEVISQGSVSSVAVFGFFSLLTLEDPSILWTILNIAQFISYLPLINLKISADLFCFLKSFQSANFFRNFLTEHIPISQSEVPYNFYLYGISQDEFLDTNFLRNAARFTMTFLAIGSAHLLIRPLAYLIQCRKLRVKVLSLSSQWKQGFIRLWVQFYLDFIISSYVEIGCIPNESPLYSILVSFLVFGIASVTPIVSAFFVLKRTDCIRKPDSKLMEFCGPFFSEVNTDRKMPLFYITFLSIRRLFFCLILFYLPEYPVFVLGSQLAVSVLFVYYLCSQQVLKNKVNQFVYVFGESAYSLTVLFLLLPEIEVHSHSFEFVIMLINIVFVSVGSLILVVGLVVHWCKHRKQRNQVHNVLTTEVNVIEFGSSPASPRDFQERKLMSMQARSTGICITHREQDLYEVNLSHT